MSTRGQRAGGRGIWVTIALIGLLLTVGAASIGAATATAAAPTEDAPTDAVLALGTDAGETGAQQGPSSEDALNRTNRTSHARDTGVIWRGFRHAWSYNHRFNRFGSWVTMRDCDRDLCDYEVGHAAASGSGEDKASVRDAYTEVSAANVGFYATDVTFDLEGHEQKPDGSGRMTRTRTLEVDIGSDIDDYDEYAVVINGFDVKKTDGHSGKVIDFETQVGQPTRDGDTLRVPVRTEMLLDCDSFECKGPLPLKKLRGGKFVQDITYEMDVHYVVVGGDARAFDATTTSAIENSYAWDNCRNNKIENPFTDVEEDDNWGSNVFPGNRMNCERSEDRELDYSDFVRQTSIRSAGDRFTAGTVGVTSLSVNMAHETHFTQYDSIIGGDYDSGTEYVVKALPFYKEWASRHGQYSDARFSYGFEGSGSTSVTPILLEFRDACKRSFVNGGGIHWEGGGKNPTTSAATITEQYRFAYGNQWQGSADRGSACDNSVEEPSVPVSPSADPAFWVPADGGSLWDEFSGGEPEDPTKFKGVASDRYYSGEQENPPTDTADLRNVEFIGVTDEDDDGNASQVWTRLDADLNYDDPIHGPSDTGDPWVEVEFRRVNSKQWTTVDEFDMVAFDGTREFTVPGDRPAGKYTHARVTVSEQLDDGSIGPQLEQTVVALPRPMRFEPTADDRTVEVYIDSTPQGAEVYLDGHRVGTTPIDGEIPAGERDSRKFIEFRKEGYQNRRLPVRLDDSGRNTISTQLYRPDKPIVVRSSPTADVYIRGNRYGETPLVLERPPGETVDVELRPNDDAYLSQTFENVSAPATINATLITAADLTNDHTTTPVYINDYTIPQYPVINVTNVTDTDESSGEDDTLIVDYDRVDDPTLSTVDRSFVTEVPELSSLTVANATVPSRTVVYANATFDARGSYSLAGSIESYEWTFGDGETDTGAVVRHTYESGGTYDVTLTVTANGTTATTTKQVTVVDRPPTARFSVADPPVERDEATTFDATASVDPEGNLSAVHWEMGDGASRTGQRIAHTYTETGPVTVTMRVVDAAGNEDTVSRTIEVEEPNDPPSPALSVSDQTAPVGQEITFEADASEDPDGSIERYEWRFENGVRAVGESLEYAFERPGYHDVTLVVVDDDGATRSVTKTVQVTQTTRTGGDDSNATESATGTDAIPIDLPMPGFGLLPAAVALVVVALLSRRWL